MSLRCRQVEVLELYYLEYPLEVFELYYTDETFESGVRKVRVSFRFVRA